MLQKYVKDLKKEFAGYNAKGLLADIMAGLTVAAVALAPVMERIPLCALAGVLMVTA